MKTTAIRLATGIAGSAALLGAMAMPAFAYYPYGTGGYVDNSSAYCSDRYSSSCIQQSWGPGYFQNYNTNYGTWYQTSAPYNSYGNYGYTAQYPTYYQPSYSYNNYNYVAPTYNNYSMPSYGYQYQYQYQYQYHYGY